jgi:UDP-galactopyranose mutase
MFVYGSKKMSRVLIIGAGWTGASAAHKLRENNHDVLIVEKDQEVGGHSRSGRIKNIVWEPYGAHIFHTSNEEVADFVKKFGMKKNYEHKVLTKVMLDGKYETFSWPPQIEELKKLKNWREISKELNSLPNNPEGENFIDYIISMMGKTLYEMFIEGYSIKQWGDELNNLSSRFAPKRIELRDDGYKRLFRDKYEFFPEKGVTPIIENILQDIEILFSNEVNINNISDLAKEFDYIIMTCPLDSFLGRDTLKWKGIRLEPKHFDVGENEFQTESYVINYPGLEVPYTRTIETKHATGQKVNGTIVAEEYPGSSDRHYPILTPENIYENENNNLKDEISSNFKQSVIFAGRLANYSYINQDQAILQGFAAADLVRKNTL